MGRVWCFGVGCFMVSFGCLGYWFALRLGCGCRGWWVWAVIVGFDVLVDLLVVLYLVFSGWFSGVWFRGAIWVVGVFCVAFCVVWLSIYLVYLGFD